MSRAPGHWDAAGGAALGCGAGLRQPSIKLHCTRPLPHHPLAGSIARPRYIEDEREFGARSVHTVIVYTAAGGWGAATWLRLQLEGNASLLFDAATFGAVYVRAVSAPYMVRWHASMHAVCIRHQMAGAHPVSGTMRGVPRGHL